MLRAGLPTIESLGQGFELEKAMQGDGLECGEDCRPLARQGLANIIKRRKTDAVDRWLDSLGVDDVADWRNGHCRRHLLTKLCDIEVAVLRTMTGFSPGCRQVQILAGD